MLRKQQQQIKSLLIHGDNSAGFFFQLISFQSNPYTWDARMLGIDSMVIDVIVRTKNGLQIKITDLSEPIGLYITNKRKQ